MFPFALNSSNVDPFDPAYETRRLDIHGKRTAIRVWMQFVSRRPSADAQISKILTQLSTPIQEPGTNKSRLVDCFASGANAFNPN